MKAQQVTLNSCCTAVYLSAMYLSMPRNQIRSFMCIHLSWILKPLAPNQYSTAPSIEQTRIKINLSAVLFQLGSLYKISENAKYFMTG